MVTMLLGLYKIARDSFLGNLVELGSAAAIVYGVFVQWGSGPAWIVGGVAGLLKAFELDLTKPASDE